MRFPHVHPRTAALRTAACALAAIALVLPFPCHAQAAASHDMRGDSIFAAQALANGLRIAKRYHVAAITTRRFDHDAFWRAVEPSLASPDFQKRQVGASILGRSINAVTFGTGKTTVLLWSQMHGDESTATMALADIFRFLAQATHDPLRQRLHDDLTIVFVPMLNPDGAELFQRENAAGIDINRDARRLATPEARALKALRDSIRPAFGFNLHDQNARTIAGAGGMQAAIALEAPAFSDAGNYNDVRRRARLVAATIAQILGGSIPGRIAKYDESFNRRAFGDNMQKWGTSTVLVESGGLPNDPQKQRLRALNVAAILGALDAIGTGRYADADPQAYQRLPSNHGGASDLLILGGQLVLPGQPPLRADMAINYHDAIARTGAYVRDVGDLQEAVAVDTVNAAGLFLIPAASSLYAGNGGSWLRIGEPASFALRRGKDSTSALVMTIGGAAGRGP
ncbi:MAG TPA: M14 family zinc carboxypeptidase [Gemmatimonadaceae bacterium]|nr:M14 family zinc carboxypeptidase [Gemmatimonadaceae bacterium]